MLTLSDRCHYKNGKNCLKKKKKKKKKKRSHIIDIRTGMITLKIINLKIPVLDWLVNIFACCVA